MARVLFTLLLCAAATFARAQDEPAPPAGLMWNRSGLPAVFPLQVKTPPGQDYFLILIDATSGDAALAAYIKGGAFFKVLVPPGEFRLRFATGKRWQGEGALFGPGADTRVFELTGPLTFETRGLGVKAGHVVTLPGHGADQTADIGLKDQLVCQFFRLGLPLPIPLAQRADGAGPLSAARRAAKEVPRFLSVPGYEIRSRYCG